MKRTILIVILLSFLVAACNRNGDKADAYGNFEAIEIIVSAENQGKLISFDAEEGDLIGEGQIVGIIDTIQLSLKIEQLEAGLKSIDARAATIRAQIESSKVQKSNIQREYDRISRLFNDGAATSKQKDDLEGQLQLIKSQIEAYETQIQSILSERQNLEVQIEQVREKIRRSYISNPLEGIMLQKYKHAGESILPGQVIYKIANMDHLILRAYISGNQLSDVKFGDKVLVRIDADEESQELEGSITWISSEAEFTPKIIQTREERVSLVYAMKVKVDNNGQLKIGMPGEVVFLK